MSQASALLRLVEDCVGLTLPIRLRSWDGREAGPAGAPVVVIRNRRALRHVLWSPGELGVARAYVQGDLDVQGDLSAALRAVWMRGGSRAADRTAGRPRVRAGQVARAAALAVRLGALGRRPPRPAAESVLTGELHSKERDLAAISHHYDLSNDFYELILDPNMAYSSGFHTTPEVTLEEAQTAKLHLVCRKLGLQPGMKMVDIGSGWGSQTLFAAEHYGVQVTGATLSGRAVGRR